MNSTRKPVAPVHAGQPAHQTARRPPMVNGQPMVGLLMALATILMVLAGCSGDAPTTDEAAADLLEIADVVDETPGNEGLPTPTSPPAPTPTATAVPLPSAEEIYAELSPSIAYIVTGDGGSGSGVLIEGGYVITNHHVLEFDDSARVVFPNGTEIRNAPVFATNPQADLAILGPIDTALPEVPFTGVEVGRPGSTVFLLGYPDESDVFPEATFTQGIVSRYREMPLHGYNFVQVDALIAPGQSGGVLINDAGELVGISGLRFGEGNFGLVMDAPTVRNELDQMFDDPPDFTRAAVGRSVELTVRPGRASALVVDIEGNLSVSATSEGDISMELMTLSGGIPPEPEVVVDYFIEGRVDGAANYVDEGTSGTEVLNVDVQPGRYLLSFSSFEAEQVLMTVEANVELLEFVEVDDGLELMLGEPSFGLYDFATDADEWTVNLTAGTRVRVRTDSISDAVVVIRRNGVAVASGDDDLVGLFGNSVDFEFAVPATDTYQVIIGRFGFDTGGYAVQIDEL